MTTAEIENDSDSSSSVDLESSSSDEYDDNPTLQNFEDLPSDEYDDNPTLQNFEDLPSDDSVTDEDSDSPEEHSNHPLHPTDTYLPTHPQQSESLADQLHKQRTQGRPNMHDVRQRKTQALAEAHKKLQHLKTNSTDHPPKDKPSNPHVKKRSKHAPTIASSRKSAHLQRQTQFDAGNTVELNAHAYKPRDPRMQTLSGYHDEHVFENRYAFLDQLQEDELTLLKKKSQAWNTTGRKGRKLRKKLGVTGEEQEELSRLLMEKKEKKVKERIREGKRKAKKEILDEIGKGKRGAYYVSKGKGKNKSKMDRVMA